MNDMKIMKKEADSHTHSENLYKKSFKGFATDLKSFINTRL